MEKEQKVNIFFRIADENEDFIRNMFRNDGGSRPACVRQGLQPTRRGLLVTDGNGD